MKSLVWLAEWMNEGGSNSDEWWDDFMPEELDKSQLYTLHCIVNDN